MLYLLRIGTPLSQMRGFVSCRFHKVFRIGGHVWQKNPLQLKQAQKKKRRFWECQVVSIWYTKRFLCAEYAMHSPPPNIFIWRIYLDFAWQLLARIWLKCKVSDHSMGVTRLSILGSWTGNIVSWQSGCWPWKTI